MRRLPRALIALLATVAPADALAGRADAEVMIFTGESTTDATNWFEGRNWKRSDGTPGHPPAAGDDAIISSGRTANLSSGGASVKSIVVSGLAHLDVDGQTLNVVSDGSAFFGVLRVFGNGTLVLRGAATWAAGPWGVGRSGQDTGVGGTIENHGALRITGNTRASNFGVGGGVLRNRPGATITRAGAAGSAEIAIPLDNDGAVGVESGRLVLQDGSGPETSDGSFTVAQGAELSSLGGHRLGSPARVTGPGTLRLDAGRFEMGGGTYDVGTTLATGGVLDLGAGTGSTARLTSEGTGGGIRGGALAVGAGDSRLDNIEFDGGARVTFAAGATVAASGTVRVNGGAIVTLDGATTWSAGTWGVGRAGLDTGIGGVVENRGHLRITANTLLSNFGVGGGVVRNLQGGTITREGATGTASITVPLRNAGRIAVVTGRLETTDVVQSDGAISVAGGATFGGLPSTPITLAAGTLRGTGTVSGVVANDGGTVSPGDSPGVLSIVGSYTQGVAGTLAVEIEGDAPGSGHDRLAVNGPATLGGTLAIATGAGFDPPLDSVYDVVTATERRGIFDPLRALQRAEGFPDGTVTGADPPGKHYRDEYGPTFARLRVGAGPVPAPTAGEPIIFLPGFLGSRMVCDGTEAWPNTPLARPLAMRLAPDGMTDLEGACAVPEGREGLIESVVGKDVYRSTLAFLERIAPGRVHVFTYDWRKSPADSAAALDALVERVREGGKVVLLGHSMGGLVTRMYIDDPARAAKVARAVTLGTAYWGTPKALFPLAAGVESPEFSALNVLITRQDMQALARNLPGLYVAWPSAPFGRWLTVDGIGRDPRRLVRFVGGNVPLYDRAQADHARALDKLDTNGVDYHVVVGTGEQTVEQVRITPTSSIFNPGLGGQGGGPPGGIYKVRWGNGDETVPRSSAELGGSVPEGHLHHVCGIDHLELAQEDAVLDRIGGFLRAGEPIAGTEKICRAEGVEVETFTLALGAGRSRADGSMTLEQADREGAIELLDFGAQKVFAANASRPVKLRLDGRGIGLRVTPLGDDGERGRPRYYGPLSGTLTIDAGAGAKIRRGGRVVRPRPDDDRPPRTRVRVRLVGRDAVLRFRATDSSAVAATFAQVGGRPAARVRRTLRVRRGDLKRVRFQSVDVFGNVERSRRYAGIGSSASAP